MDGIKGKELCPYKSACWVQERACAKFSVNTEEMWYNGIIGREHRKEEKNGKTKEIPVDE